jgi:hypothetical protein
MTPVATTAEALAWCSRMRIWAVGMCGQFCAAAYGYGASGYGDALAQWQLTPAGIRHPGDTDAPPGALLFWAGGSAGHGHVAVADGTGACFSTDISGPGTVSRVSASMISSRWGLPYLGWTYPFFQDEQWSPAMIKGVDVSRFQAVSGWQTGIDFAFTKVTQGTSYVNSEWVSQRNTMRLAGLVVGYYHFLEKGNVVPQADFFLSKITLRPGDVLACDWETNPNTGTGATNAEKDAWISYVQNKTGHRVILYCNKDYWINRDSTGFAGDGLWIATAGLPAGQPGIRDRWLIHQYSTAGNLDHDVAQFIDRAAMIAWAGGEDVALTASELKLLTETHDALTKITSLVDGKVHQAGYYLAHGQADLAAVLAQARANGAALTQVKNVLGALDLSQVPAEVAAKIEALKLVVTVTEGT